MTTASHTNAQPGRYTIAVKVMDIFGNDTMTLVPVTVGKNFSHDHQRIIPTAHQPDSANRQ